MSFDIFLQRFENGDGADADAEAILGVLEPLINERSGSWARLVTSDGEADVYGIDNASSGLMVNHAVGRHVWDVLYEVARVGRMAVMPVGCPTCVCDPAMADHMPEGAPPVEIVRSGSDILRVVDHA